MRNRSLISLMALLATVSSAQVPIGELANPPATARHFIIESPEAKHGESWSWVTADGTRMGRESMNLRGQISELDYSGRAGADGMPASMTIRGFNPQGDAAETYTIAAGTASWHSPVDAGSAPYSNHPFYLPLGGPIDTTAWFLEQLLASPDKSLDLLPGGKARAVKLAHLDVGKDAERQTINLWAVTGINNSPEPMWADSHDQFFALTYGGFGWLPEAYALEQRRMELTQTAALAAQTAALAKSLVKVPDRPVAFVSVRMYDADGVRFLADQTVVVDKGIITAVGPAAAVKVPARAQIFDGHGMTLVPGLWDCHLHVQDDYTGLQELSMGVTSVRDPGNVDALTIDRRSRASADQLLFPHVYPSALIDGKGPYSAQVGSIATSETEAIALVDRAKANGFNAIKIYGTFNSAWLPDTIKEAHKLGLHVHGHIPVGIRPMEAVNDGYDEITHINWVIMQAMPDSVIAVSNGVARMEGPGRYARDVDLDGAAMSEIVSTMAKKHIYSDPTMVVYESDYVPENGDLSPAYTPFVGTLPPTVERQFRTGGLAVPKDLTRADYRASWRKLVALLGRMHRAEIPIVAGTDGSGIELVRELEIYTDAGFTPAEALATATIVPAQLLGVDKQTGSIKVGKAADLALVAGDPSTHIGDLRQTRVVTIDGKLLDADALREAAGYSGRPK
jgi:imidazolonepropionase-like amidohydrolase